MIFNSFFFTEKKLPYVVTHDVCLSVCLSVCPSSVEISLERGCTITNRSIDLKFYINIGGMSERRDFSKFELQVANLCNLSFFL